MLWDWLRLHVILLLLHLLSGIILHIILLLNIGLILRPKFMPAITNAIPIVGLLSCFLLSQFWTSFCNGFCHRCFSADHF